MTKKEELFNEFAEMLRNPDLNAALEEYRSEVAKNLTKALEEYRNSPGTKLDGPLLDALDGFLIYITPSYFGGKANRENIELVKEKMMLQISAYRVSAPDLIRALNEVALVYGAWLWFKKERVLEFEKKHKELEPDFFSQFDEWIVKQQGEGDIRSDSQDP
jgi:hypothetical protein